MTISSDESWPAVFLDRDGTVMRDVDYCGDPQRIEILSGATEALRQLKSSGYKLIVVTNQSGINRGYFSKADYRRVEQEFNRQLGATIIDGTYYCPDLPDTNSGRRKPSPEMVFEARREHNLDLSRSYFIGDKGSDIECGRNAGVRTILVETGYGAQEINCGADWVARDLAHAAEIILNANHP